MYSIGQWTIKHEKSNKLFAAEVKLPDGIYASEGVPGLQEWSLDVTSNEYTWHMNHLSRADITTIRNLLTAVLADTED